MGSKECKKHGRDYIEFKCRFCCSIAVWFCFGTTHFCDSCHNKRPDVNKRLWKKLQCPGINRCPLKMAHAPTGQEFSLGCALCRNFKENAVDF